jgi:hypothetical protein
MKSRKGFNKVYLLQKLCACVLRRVSALLLFCSSFGSRNAAQCCSQCAKMLPTVLKLKCGQMFAVRLYMHIQTLNCLTTALYLSPYLLRLLWRNWESFCVRYTCRLQLCLTQRVYVTVKRVAWAHLYIPVFHSCCSVLPICEKSF